MSLITKRGYFVVKVEKENSIQYIKSYTYVQKANSQSFKTYISLTNKLNEARVWKIENGVNRAVKLIFNPQFDDKTILIVENITKKLERTKKLKEIFNNE
jgi:hypothetical protein